MTRDEVIKMAMETGASHLKPDGHYRSEYYACTPDALERLVQAAFNAGAAAEREEFEKVCEEISIKHHKAYKGKDPSREQDIFSKYVEGLSDGANECLDAIRARKGGA